jgi:hypothetical protein
MLGTFISEPEKRARARKKRGGAMLIPINATARTASISALRHRGPPAGSHAEKAEVAQVHQKNSTGALSAAWELIARVAFKPERAV